MLSLPLRLCCLVVAWAHFVNAVTHIVKLPQAEYAGVALSNGVSHWLGIPYAAPPIGRLRFAPPIDPPQRSGIQAADTVSEFPS